MGRKSSGLSPQEQRRLSYARNREKILASQKAYRETHKAEVKERWKRWRSKHRADLAEKSRKYHYANRDTCIARSRQYYAEHKQRANQRALIKYHNTDDKTAIRCRTIVARAVRSRRLVRPDICSRCGKWSRIEAHHIDYSKPLAIIWLCRYCHTVADKERRLFAALPDNQFVILFNSLL